MDQRDQIFLSIPGRTCQQIARAKRANHIHLLLNCRRDELMHHINTSAEVHISLIAEAYTSDYVSLFYALTPAQREAAREFLAAPENKGWENHANVDHSQNLNAHNRWVAREKAKKIKNKNK